MSQAFHTALNGRPGPVVISLPEDMLVDEVEVADAGPYKIARGAPAPDDIATLRTLLEEARKPMVIVGGGGWTAQACADIKAFIEANDLPVCASFRNQDLFDNRHPNYAGDLGVGVGPALGKRLKECDLIVAVGPRLGEATTGGYTLFDLPVPAQKLVHVHAGAEELGRVYQATLPINSGMAHFAAAAKAMKPVDGTRWKAETATAHAEYLDNIKPGPLPGAVNMGRGHRLAEQAAARRRHRHQRRRQLRRLPASLLPVSRLQDPACADQRRHGLRACRRRWRPRSPSPAAWWCRWPATAVS